MTYHIFKAAEAVPAPARGVSDIAGDDMGFALFIDTLTHDDRNSFYRLTRKIDGKWDEGEAYRADELRGLWGSWWFETDSYLSRNGLAGHSRSGEIRQITGLFYDLDAHGDDCAGAVSKALEALEAAASSNLVPKPTMIVHTGRGLHLYYMLKRSVPTRKIDGGATTKNEAALSLLTLAEDHIGRLLDKHVCEKVEGVSNDKVARGLERVVRLPGSFNTEAGAYCRLIAHSSLLYTLEDLRPEFPSRPENQKQQGQRLGASPAAMRWILLGRVGGIERLVAYREGGGGTGPCTDRCRNEALFAHHCAALKAMDPIAARQRTLALNASFAKPLPLSEAKNVLASAARKGYRLSNSWVRSHLNVTDAEEAAVGLFSSKRSHERARARENTAARKAERDARIIELRSTGLTQDEIASTVGCSRRTVSTVLERAGMTQPRKSKSPVPHVNNMRKLSRLRPSLCKKAPQRLGSEEEGCLGGGASPSFEESIRGLSAELLLPRRRRLMKRAKKPSSPTPNQPKPTSPAQGMQPSRGLVLRGPPAINSPVQTGSAIVWAN